jgi:hypothetical protein
MHILLEKNITDIKEVSKLCRKYVTDNEATLNELGVTKEDLCKSA